MQERRYNVNNIITAADGIPNQLIDDIQALLEEPNHTVVGITPHYNLITISHELAYWANLNAYLTGLWGRLRKDAGTNKHRIAMRDYLEAAASVSRKTYDAVSRIQSSYELIYQDTRMENRRER
jgi:hypothetical protein